MHSGGEAAQRQNSALRSIFETAVLLRATRELTIGFDAPGQSNQCYLIQKAGTITAELRMGRGGIIFKPISLPAIRRKWYEFRCSG